MTVTWTCVSLIDQNLPLYLTSADHYQSLFLQLLNHNLSPQEPRSPVIPRCYRQVSHLIPSSIITHPSNPSISFIPFFLGGVNVGSGNKPPWTLPAKAAYGKFDAARAKKYHGLEKMEVPAFFPPLTILVRTSRPHTPPPLPQLIRHTVY